MTPRKKRSPIWLLPADDFVALVSASKTQHDILRAFGFANKGSNYRTLKERLIHDNIDYTHLERAGDSLRRYAKMRLEQYPLEEMLIENSSANRQSMKKRLLANGMLRNECYICGQLPTWQDKPLTLQIDHINGVHNDNRLCNLRILCLHCHSQTDTWSGRNQRRPKQIKPSIPRKTKITWPDNDTLQKMLWETPTSRIAQLLGVSDKAVNKHAKKHGLSKPGRGYWTKILRKRL